MTQGKIDTSALFKIGYGLYVVTCHDGIKDNGLILNSIIQLTSSPLQVGVVINKQNYSHDVILESGEMNVNCLSVEAPFKVFEAFGFKSGRDTDKFEGCSVKRSDNGLVVLPKVINGFISLKVKSYTDLQTHGMFVCEVTEAQVVSDVESMTYAYYHANVKPKPESDKKRGYVCTVCGYVYEGDELPDDYVCPVCYHGADAFEPFER